MSILVFQHERKESLSRLGRVLVKYGHRLRIINLWSGEAVPPDLDDVDAVISLGGAMNVSEAASHAWMNPEMSLLRQAHERELPVIGVCLGSQLIAAALGGTVEPMANSALEIGWHEIRLAFPGTLDTILTGQPWRMQTLHWHGQQVSKLPAGAIPLAGSKLCKFQAWKAGIRTYGFQYHFELSREEIEEWSLRLAPERSRAGLTHDRLMTDTSKYYDEYDRLSTRLCRSIADFLIPARQVLIF